MRKRRWIAYGAAGALGLGLVAGTAAAAASTMELRDTTGTVVPGGAIVGTPTATDQTIGIPRLSDRHLDRSKATDGADETRASDKVTAQPRVADGQKKFLTSPTSPTSPGPDSPTGPSPVTPPSPVSPHSPISIDSSPYSP